jgi:DNA-binding CsgD family transcriptional regulator
VIWIEKLWDVRANRAWVQIRRSSETSKVDYTAEPNKGASMSTAKLSNMIEAVYEAAADAEALKALAPRLAALLDAPSAVVQTRFRETGFASLLSVTSNFTPKSLETYQQYFYRHDEWVKRCHLLNPHLVHTSAEVISDREWESTEIYTDYCRHVGLYDFVGFAAPAEFGTVIFGVHRSKKDPRFSANTKKSVELLLPHIRKALELRTRLDTAGLLSQAALDALERLTIAIVIVDRFGRLIISNGRGEALLRDRQGITVRNSRLETTDSRLNDRLKRMVAGATASLNGRSEAVSDYFMIIPRAGSPLALTVLPLSLAALRFSHSGPLAIVFVSERQREAPGVDTLYRHYGLTPAEARLFQALVDGVRLQEYADRRGLSRNTVHTQLKQIFAKTGYSRQSELVREAWANAALRIAGQPPSRGGSE